MWCASRAAVRSHPGGRSVWNSRRPARWLELGAEVSVECRRGTNNSCNRRGPFAIALARSTREAARALGEHLSTCSAASRGDRGVSCSVKKE